MGRNKWDLKPKLNWLITDFDVNWGQRVHIRGLYCIHLVLFDFNTSVSSIPLVFAHNQNIIQSSRHTYDCEWLDQVVDEIVPVVGNRKMTPCE